MRLATSRRASGSPPLIDLCEQRRMLANTYDFIQVQIDHATGTAATIVPPGVHTLDELGLGAARPFFPDSSEFSGIDDLFAGDNLQNLVDDVNNSTDLVELSLIDDDTLPSVNVNVASLGLELTFHFQNATQHTVDFQLETSPDQGTLDGHLSYTGEGGTKPGAGQAGVFERVLYVNGTAGNDSIILTPISTGVNVVLNGSGTNFSAADYVSIAVTGGAGNDRITAGGVRTKLSVDAGAGSDYVLGGKAADVINGGAGNDSLSAGAGKNRVDGGDGNDRLSGSNSPDALKGGAGRDRLYGNGGNDKLDGGGSADRLFGGAGHDLMVGGGSNDRLFGESGNDTFVGGAGTDHIEGGFGVDTADDNEDDELDSIEVLV